MCFAAGKFGHLAALDDEHLELTSAVAFAGLLCPPAISLPMKWPCYSATRNILGAMVFHITAVYFNEVFATHPDSKIIQTLYLLVLASVLVMRDKEFFFERAYRRSPA